ncbi:MAG: hypothetical protein GEU74_07750 [Nitriliruptorales bacterium]|nr:hypothetical protein [Nitriliruptorales bacterium]
MTTPFLRAAWLAVPDAADADAAVLAYAADVADSPQAGVTAPYVLVPRTPVMRDITGRLEHMDVHRYDVLPTHLLITEIETLAAGLAVEQQLAPSGTPALTVVVHGLYREVDAVEGTLGPPLDGPAPAIQFGTFNMRSADDEWAVSQWYEDRRLPSFSRIKGGHRARRLVSVCGGPAKLGVFYEFRSLEDRREHFEPLETVDHDRDRPTAAARTIHPPMSPSVGALLPRGLRYP